MRTEIRVGVLAGAVLLSGTAGAQTEIQWWHSMQGALNDKVNELANGFNASQKEYKVVAIFKGQYPESMTAAIAAVIDSGYCPLKIATTRSEEHTSELQSHSELVCRLLLEKKKTDLTY